MNGILKTVPLGASDWLVIVPAAFAIILAEEVKKFFVRNARRKTSAAAVFPT